MLFVYTEINGTWHYISNVYYVGSSHQWDAHVESISSNSVSLSHDYGGFLSASYGGITLNAELFTDDWPPPKFIYCGIKAGASETLTHSLWGTYYALDNFDRESVKYVSCGTGFTDTDDSSTFNDTLVNVFSTFCTTLGLTLDSSKARSSSPDVVYTNSTERLVIDMMAECAAGFTHWFYISGTTLYLLDMLDSSAATQSLDEFDFEPVSYTGPNAISAYISGDYSVAGDAITNSDLNVTVWHDTQTNIEDALDDIKTVMERYIFTFSVADVDVAYPIGTMISFTDESTPATTSGKFLLTKKTISFSNSAEKLVLSGRGVFT